MNNQDDQPEPQSRPEQGPGTANAPPAPKPILSVKAVHKTYTLGKRTLEVLRGVDLQVARGDFLALRGASGAGKSTLLYLMGGLDVPNRGEVWLEGRNLASLSRRELARVRNEQVGFIFQFYYLLPELDALENVCLPARMARKSPRATVARAGELLARVGLADRIEHKPYELSGGEQQRVAIARAMINEPQLILADEPTGNLDSHTGEEIINLLASLSGENGTTLVMATHDSKLASRAPTCLHIVDGLLNTSAPRDQSAQTTP